MSLLAPHGTLCLLAGTLCLLALFSRYLDVTHSLSSHATLISHTHTIIVLAFALLMSYVSLLALHGTLSLLSNRSLRSRQCSCASGRRRLSVLATPSLQLGWPLPSGRRSKEHTQQLSIFRLCNLDKRTFVYIDQHLDINSKHHRLGGGCGTAVDVGRNKDSSMSATASTRRV